MAIKDLAVAYNASANADTAVEFAIQMCRKYQSALTGLYVEAPVRFEGQIQRWISDEVMKDLKRAEREASDSIEAKFRETVAATDFAGTVEWIREQGHPNTGLARLARYFDLLLIGQFSNPADTNKPVRAEDLVLMSGTPLITVPHGYEVRPFEEYAVVAWDGSRPAARALSDAMQILETKKRLDVVTVGAKGKGGADAAAPVPDMITHLQRHGIDARRIVLSASREGVGQTILDYCAENDPDVLVMGAYSQARLREDLFGGVTKHVLNTMCVPVLMAH
jgi:nucleotide-binding universal stress UspA family protein